MASRSSVRSSGKSPRRRSIRPAAWPPRITAVSSPSGESADTKTILLFSGASAFHKPRSDELTHDIFVIVQTKAVSTDFPNHLFASEVPVKEFRQILREESFPERLQYMRSIRGRNYTTSAVISLSRLPMRKSKKGSVSGLLLNCRCPQSSSIKSPDPPCGMAAQNHGCIFPIGNILAPDLLDTQATIVATEGSNALIVYEAGFSYIRIKTVWNVVRIRPKSPTRTPPPHISKTFGSGRLP